MKISHGNLNFKILTLALLLTSASSVLAGKDKRITDCEQADRIAKKRKLQQNSERNGDEEAASDSSAQGKERKRAKSSTDDQVHLTDSKSEAESDTPLSPLSPIRESKGKEKKFLQEEEEEEGGEERGELPLIQGQKPSLFFRNFSAIEAQVNSLPPSPAQENHGEEEEEKESGSKGEGKREEKELIHTIGGLTAADVRKLRPIGLLFFQLNKGFLSMQVSSILTLLEGASAPVAPAQEPVVLLNDEGQIGIVSLATIKERWNINDSLPYKPGPCSTPNIFNKLFPLLVPEGKLSQNSVIVGGVDSDSQKPCIIRGALLRDYAQGCLIADPLRARQRSTPIGEAGPAPVYGATPKSDFHQAASAGIGSRAGQRGGADNRHIHRIDHRESTNHSHSIPAGAYNHGTSPIVLGHTRREPNPNNPHGYIEVRRTMYIFHDHRAAPTPVTPAAPTSVAPPPDASPGDEDSHADE